jgi:microcystin-dependent protein
MAYTVNKSDGSQIAVVQDGQATKDYSSVVLIGKGKPNYGEILNENLVWMVENFAKGAPPDNPLEGQLWYDLTNKLLKLYKEGVWVPVSDNAVTSVSDLNNVQNPRVGTLAWHINENILYVYDDDNTGVTGTFWKPLVSSDATVPQPYKAQKYFEIATLDNSATNVAWPLTTAQVAQLTLNTNKTLSNAGSMKPGAVYVLMVRQDGTGFRTLTFSSAYKWSGMSVPPVATSANSLTIYHFVSDGANMYGSVAYNSDSVVGWMPPAPPGDVIYLPGDIVPCAYPTAVKTDWLECNGQSVSRTTYAELFAAIGTTYGAGNGTTTFNVPDLRGRTIVGAGAGAGLTNRVIAAIGGAELVALNSNTLPVHAHHGWTAGVGAHGHPYCVNGAEENAWNSHGQGGFPTRGGDVYGPYTGWPTGNSDATVIGGGGAHNHEFWTESAGAGAGHQNMMPFIVLRYIICTKTINSSGGTTTTNINVTGINGVTIQDDTSTVATDITTLNFGGNVTATATSASTVTINVPDLSSTAWSLQQTYTIGTSEDIITFDGLNAYESFRIMLFDVKSTAVNKGLRMYWTMEDGTTLYSLSDQTYYHWKIEGSSSGTSRIIKLTDDTFIGNNANENGGTIDLVFTQPVLTFPKFPSCTGTINMTNTNGSFLLGSLFSTLNPQNTSVQAKATQRIKSVTFRILDGGSSNRFFGGKIYIYSSTRS